MKGCDFICGRLQPRAFPGVHNILKVRVYAVYMGEFLGRNLLGRVILLQIFLNHRLVWRHRHKLYNEGSFPPKCTIKIGTKRHILGIRSGQLSENQRQTPVHQRVVYPRKNSYEMLPSVISCESSSKSKDSLLSGVPLSITMTVLFSFKAL